MNCVECIVELESLAFKKYADSGSSNYKMLTKKIVAGLKSNKE